MKKTIEVVYGNSMKINRGNYEQEAPFYSAKTVIECNGEVVNESVEYNRLRGIVDPLLKAQYNEGKMDHLRIRTKNGVKYPSVTSIISPEPYTNDPAYGVRGTEIHRICNHFIRTGKWLKPNADISPLSWGDIKYKEFFEEFKDRINFEVDGKLWLEIEMYNDDYLYSGEIDLVCLVDGKKTLVDLKTGSFKWEQLYAYRHFGNGSLKQVAIFDLKNTKLIIKDADETKYWEQFLIKRGEFKARFGI